MDTDKPWRTIRIGDVAFVHNIDYSGSVHILQGQDAATIEIEVPFETLRSFVLGYYRDTTIRNLQGASDRELERLFFS